MNEEKHKADITNWLLQYLGGMVFGAILSWMLGGAVLHWNGNIEQAKVQRSSWKQMEMIFDAFSPKAAKIETVVFPGLVLGLVFTMAGCASLYGDFFWLSNGGVPDTTSFKSILEHTFLTKAVSWLSFLLGIAFSLKYLVWPLVRYFQ